MKEKRYEFNTMTTLQYRLSGAIMSMMTDSIFNHTRDNYVAYSADELYEYDQKLAEISSNDAADKILHATDPNTPFYEFSGKFNKSFVFSDMVFNWSAENNSFYCSSSNNIRGSLMVAAAAAVVVVAVARVW